MENIINTPRDVLLYYAITCQGNWTMIFNSISNHGRLPSAHELEKVVAPYRDRSITIIDDSYPDYLSKIIHPPFALFYKGDLSLLRDQSRIISIIGSPDPEDHYIMAETREIAAEVARKGGIWFSGLSRGIQRLAMENAVEKGPVIALLASGMNRHYPIESKDLQRLISQKGLVLTPYADNEPASTLHMRERNALIGQIANLLFVPCCRAHEGVLLSVALALREGRNVATLPCHAGDSFINNELIKEGAALVENADDLLYELGFNPDSLPIS